MGIRDVAPIHASLRHGSTAALLALLATPAAPAHAEHFKLEGCRAAGDSVQLVAHLDLEAEPARVWEVLTDYERHSAFVPGVLRSHRVTTTAEGPLVEQVGETRFTVIGQRVSALLQMHERGQRWLGFRAVSGDFARLSGAWVLHPLPNRATRLYYRCSLAPRSPMPAPLLSWLARSELVPRARAVGREAERRQHLVK